jgi:hypothetical protein
MCRRKRRSGRRYRVCRGLSVAVLPEHIAALAEGNAHGFSDWPNPEVPRFGADGRFIYAGMSGSGIAAATPPRNSPHGLDTGPSLSKADHTRRVGIVITEEDRAGTAQGSRRRLALRAHLALADDATPALPSAQQRNSCPIDPRRREMSLMLAFPPHCVQCTPSLPAGPGSTVPGAFGTEGVCWSRRAYRVYWAG